MDTTSTQYVFLVVDMSLADQVDVKVFSTIGGAAIYVTTSFLGQNPGSYVDGHKGERSTIVDVSAWITALPDDEQLHVFNVDDEYMCYVERSPIL